MLKVRDLMSPNVLSFGSRDTVASALERLAKAGISGAPVTDDDGALIGMVSQADLTNARLAGTLPHPTVADVMTADLIGVYADDPALAAALEMSRHDIHRVLVWDAEGAAAGLVTTLDVVKAIARRADFDVESRRDAGSSRSATLLARDVMTPAVVTIANDDSAASAADRLAQAGISGAPVRDRDGKLAGMLSQTDLANPSRGPRRAGAHVYDLMTPELFTVYADGPALVAVMVMAKYDIHRVAVADARGELAGIITSLDLVKALVRGGRFEVTPRPAKSPGATAHTPGGWS